MAKTNKKLHFAHVPRQKNDWVSYKEKTSDKYIKSGEDNMFPKHLIELYNRSSIHGACINAVTEAIIGGGITANEENCRKNVENSTATATALIPKIGYTNATKISQISLV